MVPAVAQLFHRDLLDGRTIAVSGPAPASIPRLLAWLGAEVQRGPSSALDALVCVHQSPDELLTDMWSVVHAVAAEALIPASAGRILLLVPPECGEPVRAGVGNLARTLSVEWARFAITTVAIAPGPATSDDELATLVAFLCSEAGSYYSGCRFDLR